MTGNMKPDAFPPPLKRPCVLFVEHDCDMREMMGHILGQAGIEAVASDSMSEALVFAKHLHFDLILLDWYLPDNPRLRRPDAGVLNLRLGTWRQIPAGRQRRRTGRLAQAPRHL